MENASSINGLDIFLGIIMITSAVAGLRAGFTRVVIGLVATVVGLLMAFWSYRLLAVQLTPWITSPRVANVAGFLIIFVAIVIAGAILAAIISKLMGWIGLSWFNSLLGGLAGFVRGALVVAILANILVAFAPSPVPMYLSNSRLLPYANSIASVLAQFAPQQLKDSYAHQMDNLRHIWAEHEKRG